MSTLKLEFAFNVPRRIIYEALTDATKIMQYTRAKAEIKAEQGKEFTMLDGKIVGKFVQLRKDEYIKMEWRFNDWKQNSIVEIILQQPEEDECEIILNHNNIPQGQSKQKIEFGWKHHYMQGINQILGYPFRE